MPRLLVVRPNEGLLPLLDALRAYGFEVTDADGPPDGAEQRRFDVVLLPPSDAAALQDGTGDGPIRILSSWTEGDPEGWASRIQEMARERGRRRLLSCVLETSPDLEAWIGPQGDCQYISPSCEDLTGYPPEAYIADPSLLVKSGHHDDQDRIRTSLLGGAVAQHFCCRIVTRNGEIRRIIHRAIPCQDEDGYPIGIRVHQQRAPDEDPAHEIQRLRTLLGQTEGDRALLTAVIESLPVGVIAMGGGGELLVANPAAVPYLEQVRGAPLPAEAYVGHYRELERQLRGTDGQPLYLHLSAGPLARTGHRIFGAVGAIHDITQTRASAQARRRELAEVKQQLWRLEGTNADLALQVEALQEQVAALDQSRVEPVGTPPVSESGAVRPGDLHAGLLDHQAFPGILEAVPDQVWVLDPELRNLYVNAAGAAAARRRPGRLLGEPWTESGLATGLEREIARRAARVFAEGTARTGIWTDGVEGSPQIYQYSVRPVLEGPDVRCVVVTVRDGTGIRRFLEAKGRSTGCLNRLHTVLRAIIDQMPVGVVIAEAPSGRVIFRNPGFAGIWGDGVPSPARVAEYGVWQGIGPDGKPYTPETWPLARAVQTGERIVNEECELLLDDGRRTIYSISAGPILDEGGVAYAAAATFIDVTARRTAEDAVRGSEERFRLAARSLPQLFAIYDRSGRYLFINEVGLRLVRRRHENLIGRTDEEVFGPRSTPGYCRLLQETMASLSPRSGEIVLEGPDGQPCILLVLCLPLLQENGRCDEILLIGQDLTRDRKAAADLEGYAAELKRSNEDLQQFAHVASHDLQEPLRSIVSFVQLLERRYRGQLDSDADEIIGFIAEGGTRMQALINDLLAFSRISTRGEPFAAFSLDEAIRDALVDLRCVITESGAVVQRDPLPTVYGDRTQIVQVLVNLMNNAIKFRRPDRPPEIQISAAHMKGMWHLRVADNGIGIEPEYFDRIFVIFQRLHTRDVYPGTGIGLAIVKKIIERHGGRIWLESIPGEGSIFHFTLPMAGSDDPEAGAVLRDAGLPAEPFVPLSP